MFKETNKELIHKYIRLQHAINITGEFNDKNLKQERLIKGELEKRGFLIDWDGKIKNLEDFDFSS